ncbi:MAG: sialate O-acetylesterase [Chthoniobacteraceae bacterium]
MKSSLSGSLKMHRSVLVCLILCNACFAMHGLRAAVEPDRLFGDHAVLQQDVPVTVWGHAKPCEKVSVRFQENTVEGVADASGHWQTQLPPLKTGSPGDLIFETAEGKKISRDVVVGDVWLCAGQSNMEWTLVKLAPPQKDAAEASFPGIRQFKVAPLASESPVGETKGEWVVCSPQTAGQFTAIGFFVARDFFRRNGHPQGLINCSWGGTGIETWMSPEALDSSKRKSVVADRWKQVMDAYPASKVDYDQKLAAWNEERKVSDAAGTVFSQKKPVPPAGPGDRNEPSGCFNAMMHPLIPCTVRAVLWYQGETNWKYPEEYRNLLEALIWDWRLKWSAPHLPVVIVQLPGYGGDGMKSWPVIREAQSAVSTLPNVALAVTMDLSSKEVHPLNKQGFGERLAVTIRKNIFGEACIASGPKIVSAVSENGAMRVKVTNEGGPIVLRECENPQKVGAFEVAGVDRKFYPADARVENSDIIVRSHLVPEPVALRYCWRESPDPVLFNAEGFPSPPFRTDDWADAK